MLGIDGGIGGAIAVLGLILVQAVVLYAAYGGLETVARKAFDSYSGGN